MKKKRSNMFETNSSSVHTITLDGRAENDLKVERDGYVHLHVRSYGKNYAEYHGAEDKLMYAILTVCYTHGIWLYWDYDYLEDEEAEDNFEALQNAESDWDNCIEDLRETEEFRDIEQCVIDVMSTEQKPCKGIRFHAGNGYIDHQSQKYDSLEDFLTSNQIPNVKEFIFGKAVLRTDCD